ncbi:Uncharacterized protein YKR070W [Linum perenne]
MGFRYQTLANAIRRRCRNSPPIIPSRSFASHSFQQCNPLPHFGIAFDIDGVLLRSELPIGGSLQALKRLYDDDSGVLRIPYVFLTNGGGFRESLRAVELSRLLGVHISPLQVLQSHTPFKNLVQRFKSDLVVAVGKGEPAAVMSEYGFKNVISVDEYTSYFPGIDPLAPYKKWEIKQFAKHSGISDDTTSPNTICSQPVQGVFVVSDPVDWSRDIQVLCDILRTGGLPGRKIGDQPQLYFAHDDLVYQEGCFSFRTFRSRSIQNCIRIRLQQVIHVTIKPWNESVWLAVISSTKRLPRANINVRMLTVCRIHHNPLRYRCYGKPNPFVFKNAEAVLKQLGSSVLHSGLPADNTSDGTHHFERLYMIGDNPEVDIKGAQQTGHPWFSILTRTGVFKGTGNHDKFPADLVVDTVEEAVDYIIRKECS